MAEKIVVKNLGKRGTHKFFLHDINLTVHEGEIFALCGIQGSGKTLLTKVLQKLGHADSGTIQIDCADTGVLIPDQTLYSNLTVYQTMQMYSRLYRRHAGRAEIMNTLNVCGLRRRRAVKIKSLSPSRYTRLKIAIAIVARPRVLILDSPFSYLSEPEARQIRVVLKTLADRFGTAILLTGVSFFGIEEIFDTCAIIDGGRIVASDSYNNIAKSNFKFAKTCITTPQQHLTAKLINEKFGYKTSVYGENDVVVTVHPDKAQEMNDFLKSQNIIVDSITSVNRSIEHIFHDMRMGVVA